MWFRKKKIQCHAGCVYDASPLKIRALIESLSYTYVLAACCVLELTNYSGISTANHLQLGGLMRGTRMQINHSDTDSDYCQIYTAVCCRYHRSPVIVYVEWQIVRQTLNIAGRWCCDVAIAIKIKQSHNGRRRNFTVNKSHKKKVLLTSRTWSTPN